MQICVWTKEKNALYYGPDTEANMALVLERAVEDRTDADGTVHFVEGKEVEVNAKGRGDSTVDERGSVADPE